MRVVFWGTPDFAVPTLLALAEEGHDVAAVVTRPDRPAGRGRRTAASPVKEAAELDGIPVLQPERIRGNEALVQALREMKPDVSVVVAYGAILPQEVLDVPRHGSLNLHASLLPELRGAAPIEWAILRGYDHSGVSIMQMDAGLDTGDVLFQVREPIGEDETGSELRYRLSVIGAEAVVDTLAEIEAGKAAATPQADERATYAPKIDRDVARIDWTADAQQVARWIRGMDEVPGAWSTLGNSGSVRLFCARPDLGAGTPEPPGTVLAADPKEGLRIATGRGSVYVEEVQPPGKRRMPATDWIRGRGVAEGDRFD